MRTADIRFLQEVGMNKGQRADMAVKAYEAKKRFIGGPTDPELAKAAAGVGALSKAGSLCTQFPGPRKIIAMPKRRGVA